MIENDISDGILDCSFKVYKSLGPGLFDGRKTQWGSYVIQGPYHKIYFSGDSGYNGSFKQIGDKYGPFEYTFMECGAYDERWHSMHMMPEETAQAHMDLKGKILQLKNF